MEICILILIGNHTIDKSLLYDAAFQAAVKIKDFDEISIELNFVGGFAAVTMLRAVGSNCRLMSTI